MNPNRQTGRQLGLILLLFAWSASGWAQVPAEPMLRVNTEMHTGSVRSMAVNTDETILATGSDDKTVKLWDLATGELLSTIRIPSDQLHVGRINGVSFSPDGKTLAAGGFTGFNAGENCVYFYDVESGEMIGRSPSTAEINHLAYSPDGRFLAVAVSNGAGGIMHIYSVAEGNWLISDPQYEARCSQVAWSGGVAGQALKLAAVGYDGKFRIYDVDQGQRLVGNAPGGQAVQGCALSPDGSHLALSYQDTTAIDVINVADLTPAFSADTSGLREYNLGSVAWSQDGQMLYAGGTYDDNERWPVMVWDQGGRGRRTAWMVGQSTVFDLLPLSGGRLLMCDADPGWMMLDARGQTVLSKLGTPLERRSEKGYFAPYEDQLMSGQTLLVSADGRRVAFSYEYEVQARFHSYEVGADELVDLGTNVPNDLLLAKVQGGGMIVQNWVNLLLNQYAERPTVNGRTVDSFQDGEMSNCMAMAHDGSGFALGTTFFVRFYDPLGAQVWQQQATGIVLSVNVSADNRFVVAALDDGTIRWYRRSDGVPLLGLFPHRDGVELVGWSPDGYFKATGNGESMMGWQVNRGLDANPEFFGFDQLFKLFRNSQRVKRGQSLPDGSRSLEVLQSVVEQCRPAAEIINDLVRGGVLDPPPSVSEAVFGVPKVRFADVEDLNVDGKERVKLTILAEPQAGVDISSIDLYNNGGSVYSTSRLRLHQGMPGRVFDVELSPGRNELVAIARNVRRATSYPVKVRLYYDPQRNAVANQSPTTGLNPLADMTMAALPAGGGDLWVFAVGLENYQNSSLNLKFCVEDAQEVSKSLGERGRSLYQVQPPILMTDAQVTRSALVDQFHRLAQQVQPEDTFVFFFAGHGAITFESMFYLTTHEVSGTEEEELSAHGVSAAELLDLMHKIKAQKRVLLLDSCYSGALTDFLENGEETVRDLSRDVGIAMLASSSADQESREVASLQHGLFTNALLQHLRGGGPVSFRSMETSVKQGVEQSVNAYLVEGNRQIQEPMSYFKGEDIILGR